VFLLLASSSKGLTDSLSDSYVIFGILAVMLGTGSLLYFKKDLRQNTAVSVWIFGVFSLAVGFEHAIIGVLGGNSRITKACFFAALVSVASIYEGARRTKRIDNLKQNMIVSTIMALLITTLVLVVVELRDDKDGFAYGTSLLAFALLECCLTCFYVVFTIVAIQLPEAYTDMDDV